MTDNSKDFSSSDRKGHRVPKDRDGADKRTRKPLREVVCEIDRDILRLLLRRSNLVDKMRGANSRLDATEEKFVREAWETAVARVSRDARLSGHFFSLMQQVEFLPRPDAHDGESSAATTPKEAPRTAFNLAPAQKPVSLRLQGPISCRTGRAWLMLAAATGQKLRLGPCLMNDPLVDCVKMLNQAGASLTREGDEVIARPAAPLAAPDKVLHAGESPLNFFLLLGHYLGRPSRAKFTGGTDLQLTDLSSLRHFLPSLGARFVPVVPKSEGLPARVECSGMLPDIVSLPPDLPVELAEGLLLSAPGYDKSVTVDLSAHPQAELALGRILPILHAAGADIAVEAKAVRVTPCPLLLPEQPDVEMEAELALFLLALPLLLGGEVQLKGRWSTLTADVAGWDLLTRCGLDLRRQSTGISAHGKPKMADMLADLSRLEVPATFPAAWSPLLLTLAASRALRDGQTFLPDLPQGTDSTTAESFLHAVGLEMDESHILRKMSQNAARPAWNAPDPLWAMALALAACISPHQKLGNPGVMTGLYPAFWALYNALPQPVRHNSPGVEEPARPTRRRIVTSAVATVPPEERKEDAPGTSAPLPD